MSNLWAVFTGGVGALLAILGTRLLASFSKFNYYPQRAQRAGGIVRVWQIFGHGYDFPTWSELGTKSKVKVTYFGGKKYLEEFKKYL